MKRLLSALTSVILVLGLCVPQGAIAAFADQVNAGQETPIVQDATSGETSSEGTQASGSQDAADIAVPSTGVAATGGQSDGGSTSSAVSSATATDDNTDAAETQESAAKANAPAANTPADADADAADPTAQETVKLPLSSIVADEDIFATLYDADDKVVSTNDPKEKQDSLYSSGGGRLI